MFVIQFTEKIFSIECRLIAYCWDTTMKSEAYYFSPAAAFSCQTLLYTFQMIQIPWW